MWPKPFSIKGDPKLMIPKYVIISHDRRLPFLRWEKLTYTWTFLKFCMNKEIKLMKNEKMTQENTNLHSFYPMNHRWIKDIYKTYLIRTKLLKRPLCFRHI